MIAICLGLLVGSCSSLSGYVADHWPHWAGGEPEDVPPRPGAPGYDEFIAHRQAGQPDQTNKDATASAAVPAADNTSLQAAAPPAPAADRTNVQAPPPPAADSRSTVQGGLY